MTISWAEIGEMTKRSRGRKQNSAFLAPLTEEKSTCICSVANEKLFLRVKPIWQLLSVRKGLQFFY